MTKIANKISKEDLFDMIYKMRLSYTKIAKRFDCSGSAIINLAKKYNIYMPMKSIGNLFISNKPPSKEDLYRLYHIEKKTRFIISQIYNVTANTVSKWLKYYNINRKGIRNSITKTKLEELYINKRLSAKKMSNILKMPKRLILALLKEYNIKTRVYRNSYYEYGKKIPMPPKDELIDLYYTRDWSQTRMAKKYKVSITTMYKWIKSLNLKPKRDHGNYAFRSKDGHLCDSRFELEVDDWLFNHELVHILHPIIFEGSSKRADFWVKGYFIEADGKEKHWKPDKDKEKEECYESTILKYKIIRPTDDLDEILGFLIDL